MSERKHFRSNDNAAFECISAPLIEENAVPFRLLRRQMFRIMAVLVGVTVATPPGARAASELLYPVSKNDQAVKAHDEEAIRQSLQEWRQLYSYGDKKFSFKGYEHLYINTDELLAYDNFSPDTQTNGWKAYVALWEPLINAKFTGQVTTHFEVQRVETSGELGWSAIMQWFHAKADGKVFYSSQYGTHVWRKVNDRWRIVHEHLNGPVKVNGIEVRR